jgi:hypothetical protein
MMFELPNFLEAAMLNALRSSMNAPLVEYEANLADEARISRHDLQLLETTGLEVDLDSIEPLADGTFSYQGVPVLLYIRFQRQYSGSQDLPKFHFSNCWTWEKMKAAGRQNRYVASTRVDGRFDIDIAGPDGNVQQLKDAALAVCQNCLHKLSWKNFHLHNMRSTEKRRAVQTFSLEEFFADKGRSLVQEKPRWTPDTFPGGSYTDDFDEISARTRRAANWRCQGECGRLFAMGWQRRFLHVHHIDGVPGNNDPENLMVVCIGCHANQSAHAHLKRSRDYLLFARIFGQA